VLVIGGLSNSAGNAEDFLASAELWDPATGSFSATSSLAETRIAHTATLLPDGRVLVVGGIRVSIAPAATAELWDPGSGSFTTTGPLAEGRFGHTATLLRDGRVLVIGGGSFAQDGFDVRAVAEVWNPATGTFGPAGSLAEPRVSHTATLLPDGRVLVIGGIGRSGDASVIRSSAEVWDPATGVFTPAGSLAEVRGGPTATLLPNGSVLVVGGTGFRVTDDASINGPKWRSSSELRDPVTGAFAPAGPLAAGRGLHTATLLSDGRVLVVGGIRDDGTQVAAAEVWAP
jgi:hypothetical protein